MATRDYDIFKSDGLAQRLGLLASSCRVDGSYQPQLLDSVMVVDNP